MCVPFAPHFLGQNSRAPVHTKSQSTGCSRKLLRKTLQFIVISSSGGKHWRAQPQGTHENGIDYKGACETLPGAEGHPKRTLQAHRGDGKCLQPQGCDTNSTPNPLGRQFRPLGASSQNASQIALLRNGIGTFGASCLKSAGTPPCASVDPQVTH